MTSPPQTIVNIVAQARAKAQQQGKFYDEGVKFLATKIRSDDNSVVHSILTNSPPLNRPNDSSRKLTHSKPLTLPTPTPPPLAPSFITPTLPSLPNQVVQVIPPSSIIVKYIEALDVLEKRQNGATSLHSEISDAIASLETLAKGEAKGDSTLQQELNVVSAALGASVSTLQASISTLFGPTSASRNHKATGKNRVLELLAELEFLVSRLCDLESTIRSQDYVVHKYLAQRLIRMIESGPVV